MSRRQLTESREHHGEKLLGFYDTSFFNQFDSRYITVDDKDRSRVGARTVHFDPYSGVLYVVETKQRDSTTIRTGIAFNLRTKKYLSQTEKDKKPETDPLIHFGLSKLDPQYSEWLNKPPGHKETRELVSKLTQSDPIPIERISSKVTTGDYIIFYDHLSRLHACLVWAVRPITNLKGADGGLRILCDRPTEHVRVSTYDYYSSIEKDNLDTGETVVGAILPPDSSLLLPNTVHGCWKISKQDFELLKKFAEIPYDPSIECPMSREKYAVTIALDGMAFERWASGILSIRKRTPERYKNVTPANLEKAVAILIKRFGEDCFTQALLSVSYQHFSRIHTPRHSSKMLLVQDNAFGDIHSDIIGFDKTISNFARDLVGGAHPVAVDMEKDGFGKVGQGVFNAKSVFGDTDLLLILKKNYPKILIHMANYIKRLKPINQGDWYGNSVVYPFLAVREYFPDAFAILYPNTRRMKASNKQAITFRS